ncbi:hypothetical protein [Cryptosporangium phraense]|uniref:DUF308 domain-containing protein n=1 Tax=Cryptosporangium phraense TaxID=2593070 RepID=A0A545AGG7_9ACTN|nr:hypothetical protein [Cryptosporangium phraense]TQS40411.1 hypothetical protein FL583_34780 [Cryptosporangium phraense]
MSGIQEELAGLRAQVRSDRRTVVAPLVVFGVLVLANSAVMLLGGAAARHVSALLYWPVAGAIGLGVLWAYARRVASRDGVGEGPRSYRPVTLGYLVSLPVLALLFLPAFFVGVFGPLAWPGAILAAIGFRQRSTTLKRVAKWLAFGGAVQLLLVMISTAAGEAVAVAALGLGPLAGLTMLAAAFVLVRRAPRPADA